MWSRWTKPLQHLEEALGKFSRPPWILQTSAFSDTPIRKPKLAPLQERRMIDRCRVWAKGGDGGNGCSSTHRSRHDRRGRADGGNGGRGGDVILESSPTVWDFSSLQHHINAKRGGHGASKNKIGTRGDDKVVLVPVGTVIHLVVGEKPYVVKKETSKALDPWEIPGTFEVDESESSLQSTSSDRTGKGLEKPMSVYNCSSSSMSIDKSAALKKASRASSDEQFPQSSALCGKSKVHSEDFTLWGEENTREWESLGNENDVSEAHSEGEMDENEEDDHVEYDVAELTEPGQRVIVARGGDGGLGNLSIPKTSRRYSLRKNREKGNNNLEDEDNENQRSLSLSTGLPGSETVLILELKSIADVGFVGMPNAGKSTLLGALSRAKPAVGNYAFTTLRPNLGNLNFDDFSFTVADIPGLIRGAHENRGLGHAFLRHIERTKILAYVLDLAAALDGRKGIPPWEQLRDLILELEFYRKGLSDRPALVVANKIDEPGAEEVYEELKKRVTGVHIFPVCAVLEEGVSELKVGLRMLFNGEDSSRPTLDNIEVD